METSELKKIANIIRETIKNSSPKGIVKKAVLSQTQKEIQFVKTASQKGYSEHQIKNFLR
jgi:hypothetical protein